MCLSWASLGAVLGLSWGRLGAVLGLSWGCLGALLGVLFAPLGPGGGKTATRGPKQPQTSPKRPKKKTKREPKIRLFHVFFGVNFWNPFGTRFGRVSWAPRTLKTTISLRTSFKNGVLTKSPLRAKGARKSHENELQNGTKNS